MSAKRCPIGLLLLGLLPAPEALARGGEEERPNFVLILLDDAGWGDLACYGNWHVQTPRIDRMAEEGQLLTRFYVNAAVCSPSRLAFMTGKFPGRLGVHGVRWGQKSAGMGSAPAETPWLTGLLSEAGYRTGHFGKWHLGHPSRGPSPSAYGIDDHRTLAAADPGWSERDNEWIARSDAEIFGEALRFLAVEDERPFYLNIWSMLPHTPIAPSEEQMNVGHYENMKAAGLSGPLERFPTPMRQYDATLTEIDRQVGRLLDRLDELGLSEKTLVLITSDNGPENLVPRRNASVGSSGPFRGRKRSLYEGGVRMPCIVRWPGTVPAGHIGDAVVSAVDWMPTLCALAGVPLPAGAGLDGLDVSPILRGEHRERERPLCWEYRYDQGGLTPLNRSPMLALRRGHWKLLMNPDRSRLELYDLELDPMEVDNVAGEHPGVVQRLATELLRFHESLPVGPTAPTAGDNAYDGPRVGAR